MIQILNIETITKDHTELYCVSYSKDIADMIHYTNFDTAQLLHYIQRSRVVQGVKVITDTVAEHIINYLEQNFELLITEMIINNQ